MIKICQQNLKRTCCKCITYLLLLERKHLKRKYFRYFSVTCLDKTFLSVTELYKACTKSAYNTAISLNVKYNHFEVFSSYYNFTGFVVLTCSNDHTNTHLYDDATTPELQHETKWRSESLHCLGPCLRLFHRKTYHQQSLLVSSYFSLSLWLKAEGFHRILYTVSDSVSDKSIHL